MIQESDEKILESGVDENRLKITSEIMRYMPILWSKLTDTQRSNPGYSQSGMYGPYDSIKISFKTKDRSDESIYVTIPDDLWVHMDWTVSANETSWASVILDKIVAYMSKRHYNLEDFGSIKSMLLWRQGPSVTKTHLLANHLSDIYDTADMNAIYDETLTHVDSDIKNVNQTGIYDTNLKQETGSVIVGFMSDKFGLTSDWLKLTDPYIVHSIQFVIKLTENIADSEVTLSVLFNDAIPFKIKLSPIRELQYQTIHYVIK